MSRKNILIGITGGIAAYKIPVLVRRLCEAGYAVRVVMTAAAKSFVAPLTLQALSGEPVHSDLWEAEASDGMGHIALARWADLVLVAPATADAIARLSLGRADDLLMAVCLATRAPLAIAPAMNTAMWEAAVTQQHVASLRERGVTVWGPESGVQACGEIGPGRLCEPEALFKAICSYESAPIFGVQSAVSSTKTPGRDTPIFDDSMPAEVKPVGVLSGTHVLLTVGPTREPLDPVRYLSNRSSGKMGYALAEAAYALGASVTVVSGPTALSLSPGIRCYSVVTAQEMRDAVFSVLDKDSVDLFIAAAAVCDYRPAETVRRKIKKTADPKTLLLERNPDILAEVTQRSTRNL